MTEMVKVYRWYSYDVSGARIIPAAYSGTLEAIEAVGGVPLLETARWVKQEWIDENGFVRPLSDEHIPPSKKKPPSHSDM